MNILTYPNQILRNENETVKEVDDNIKNIFLEMMVIMKKYGGVGLAAPQVGINKRLIVIASPGIRCIMLANPKIIQFQGQQIDDEACLSIPKVKVEIHRTQDITVRGLNDNNKLVEIKLSGFLARVLQHEIDHLKGKLIIDYS